MIPRKPLAPNNGNKSRARAFSGSVKTALPTSPTNKPSIRTHARAGRTAQDGSTGGATRVR